MLDTWVLGVVVTWVLGLLVAWVLGLLVTVVMGLLITRALGLHVICVLGLLVTGARSPASVNNALGGVHVSPKPVPVTAFLGTS